MPERAVQEAAGGATADAVSLAVDVTALAAAQRDRARLADIEAELAERQRRLPAEHPLVAALQQVIMPMPGSAVRLPGIEVAVLCQPAEQLARVGGDWYDLVELPGDRSLLVVGDVAGHGIAAATMVRLRHALAAFAVTTSDPADLLGYLNRLACDDPSAPTASVVVARRRRRPGRMPRRLPDGLDRSNPRRAHRRAVQVPGWPVGDAASGQPGRRRVRPGPSHNGARRVSIPAHSGGGVSCTAASSAVAPPPAAPGS